MKKVKSIISALICIIMVASMLPAGASTFEKGKRNTFFAYLYCPNNETENILKPFDLKSKDLYSKGVKSVAKEAAYYLKQMPEGRRALDIHGVSYDLINDMENILWWDKGTEEVRTLMTKFFEALKEEGAAVDYMIDDFEAGMSNWNVTTMEKANLIVNDPRYATEIRPELESRGFRFGTEEQGELYYVVKYSRDKSAYLIWNRVMADRSDTYHNTAFYDVAKEYYPDVKLSDYGSCAYDGEARLISGASHRTYLGGPSKVHIGTHSSPVCYASMNHITNPGYGPDEYPFERFYKTGFNAIILNVMKCQSAALSTEGGGLMPWIGLHGWHSDAKYANFFGTDYYQEFIFHVGMLNPDPYLIFNSASSQEGDDLILLQNMMYQLDDLCGFDDRKPLATEAIGWTQRYVVSGMYAGGKNVWRITPDLYAPGVTMENFLIDRENLIFQIGNEVIDFPEGSYIYEPENSYSDYGYWVISPKGTYPEEFVVDTIEPALAPVETEDFIPTGYKYENNSATYNPVIHAKKTNASNTEEKAEEKEPEKAPEESEVPGIEIPNHWAKSYLTTAVKAGIIEGSAGGLMPDKNITRAEIITMLLRAFGMEADKNAGPNWYDGPIATAKKLGWIDETDDGPSIIDRQETARIMVRAFHVGETSRKVTFKDVGDVSPEMLNYVLDAASTGIINGTPDGNFNPKANITRAEAITMIIRSIN